MPRKASETQPQESRRRPVSPRHVLGAAALTATILLGTQAFQGEEAPRTPAVSAPAPQPEAPAGQTVYEGDGVDNFGDNETAPQDRPGILVVRTATQGTLTLAVSNPATLDTLTMQMSVGPQSTLWQGPLNAASLEAGARPEQLQPVSAVLQHQGETGQTTLYTVRDGRLYEDASASQPMRNPEDFGSIIADRLNQAADGLQVATAALPREAMDELL